jgi:hypothetical protein
VNGTLGAPGVHAERTSGPDGAAEVRWAPRVSRGKINRLYQLDAIGLVDGELIDEVGYALEARCRSILTVTDAQRGQVHCPRCARVGRTALIPHSGRPEETLNCAACGWSTTWDAYRKTYRRKQLNSGGALRAFQEYLDAFPRARTARKKMLAIDRLIHEFHYSLRDRPEEPTRPAGVNLIDGTMAQVIALLDRLAYGEGTAPETQVSRDRWRSGETRRRALWQSFAARRSDGVTG